METLQYAIFGVGGFANAHLSAAEELASEGLISIEAAAEPYQDQNKERLRELQNEGVSVYGDYRELLDSEDDLDIISVPTPIPLHRPMTVDVLESGANVFLEKPPAVLVQHIDEMQAAVERTGLMCQVGFQNMYDEAMRVVKQHIAAGVIGEVQEIVLEGYWRRTDNYYARSGWAGRTKLGDDWVLDGPLDNPLCHYIQNALYAVCPEPNQTARPASVQAELYHAHPIQGEDTVCARAELENGAIMHTYLSLCALGWNDPRVRVYGDKGEAEWRPGQFRVDGRDYVEEGEKPGGSTIMPMRNLVEAINGEAELESPLSATRNVILHNNGCYKSSGTIRDIPDTYVNRYEVDDGDIATEVDGLMDELRHAADSRELLSERNVEWAVATDPVSVDFDEFHPEDLDLE